MDSRERRVLLGDVALRVSRSVPNIWVFTKDRGNLSVECGKEDMMLFCYSSLFLFWRV